MGYIEWPRNLLAPEMFRSTIVPFNRSGGRTLGGLRPSYNTDLGYWEIELGDIPVHSTAQRRTWDAIEAYLSGTAGRIAVPIWSFDTANWGAYRDVIRVPHSDGSTFSDGTSYAQYSIVAETVGATAIGATEIRIRLIAGAKDLVGVRFSYSHAAYKSWSLSALDGDIWTLRISPSARSIIPDGSSLNFDAPTCLCNLKDDNSMRRELGTSGLDRLSVTFVEDTKYWADIIA